MSVAAAQGDPNFLPASLHLKFRTHSLNLTLQIPGRPIPSLNTISHLFPKRRSSCTFPRDNCKHTSNAPTDSLLAKFATLCLKYLPATPIARRLHRRRSPGYHSAAVHCAGRVTQPLQHRHTVHQRSRYPTILLLAYKSQSEIEMLAEHRLLILHIDIVTPHQSCWAD